MVSQGSGANVHCKSLPLFQVAFDYNHLPLTKGISVLLLLFSLCRKRGRFWERGAHHQLSPRQEQDFNQGFCRSQHSFLATLLQCCCAEIIQAEWPALSSWGFRSSQFSYLLSGRWAQQKEWLIRAGLFIHVLKNNLGKLNFSFHVFYHTCTYRWNERLEWSIEA